MMLYDFVNACNWPYLLCNPLVSGLTAKAANIQDTVKNNVVLLDIDGEMFFW